MAIITNDFAKALWPGVNAWYGDAYNEHEAQWTVLFEHESSEKNFEEEVGVTGFGLPVVKQQGSSITYDSQRQGFTTRYTHVVYGLGFIVTREMFEDDLYNVVGKQRARGLAFSMRQGKETVCANVYNRAFTAGYTGGDGIRLASTGHVNVTGGTWSNVETAATFSEATLEQMLIDIKKATNDRGLKIALRAKSLVIPPDLMFAARRILGSEYRPGTAQNDVNAIKSMSLLGEVHVNNYLSSTTAYFVRTDCPLGMRYFERRADGFDMDNDFDTENAKFKATHRYSVGWTDPRGLWANAGA